MNSVSSAMELAIVKYSSSKSCFVFVPDVFLKQSRDIHVFKLIYGEMKEAFVSCLPSMSMNSGKHQIQINAKFADKLGLKENEEVCLQLLFGNIPVVQELTLEPLTSDDWEVLDLNASYIERDLMNQIRVVCQNQIFPVWANNSSFFVKVAQTNPPSKPVLLAEFTEVHVVPKGRVSEESENQNIGKRTPDHLQFQHLRNHSIKRPSPLGSTPYRSRQSSDTSSTNSENKSTVSLAFSLISSLFPATNEVKDQSLDDSFRDFVPLNLDFVLRVVPYSRPQVKSLPLVVQATTVFINASTYAEIYGPNEIPPCFVAILQKFTYPSSEREKKLLKAIKDKSSSFSDSSSGSLGKSVRSDAEERTKGRSNTVIDDKQPVFQSVCVTVMVVHSSEEDEFNLPSCLFHSKNLIVVPKELKRCLNLEVSSLVHMKGVKSRPTFLNTIMLHPVTNLPTNTTNEILFTNFQNWAFGNNREDASFVISDGTLVNLRLFGNKHLFFVSLRENSNQTLNSSYSSVSSTSPNTSDNQSKSISTFPKYGYITFDYLPEIQVVLGNVMYITSDRPYLLNPEGLYQELPVLQLDTLGGLKHLAEEALENIEFWLKLRPLSFISNHPFTFSGCILICGPKGVGKSAFAKGLCKKLSKLPHYVFIRIINCLPLKGKRVDTIAKKWDEFVTEAVQKQPSVLLFEDLDYIASCPASHEQEIGPDGVYFSNIVQTFNHVMKKISYSNGRVAVIVTSQSTHSLHPTLVNTKGRHMFQTVIEIQPPNIEQRQEILRSLVLGKAHISESTVNVVDWRNIATKTEGYVAQDLDSLVDRATHAAWVRMANSPGLSEITLNLEDFQMALEGYTPSALRGIPLQVHDHKTWNDVGGLKEVKKTIQQIIMWPVKYKQIFKNYALKPQTNILLYGAPGTGKTLLAGVVANECGLNFISIKGPELLSKYIGASEQAIRDLFKRASSARPCILFFDEFDSIAPRRGHDSTGVTDRVVNQLLTQLDGVESLEGVHVIAASSRPELIDPALLRPGRLDKCLLCPLPDDNERLEILHCLSSKLSMSDDVDLAFIASRTEHFSGADLQALLYSANIEALHDSQSVSTRKYSTTSDDMTYTIASDKLLYMPTIQDGLSVPTYEDGQKIVQEVSVIKENVCGIIERRRSNRRSSMLNIVVNQKHLLKILEDMKPSVSPQERNRYDAIFKDFKNVLSGEIETSLVKSVKRVTLA